MSTIEKAMQRMGGAPAEPQQEEDTAASQKDGAAEEQQAAVSSPEATPPGDAPETTVEAEPETLAGEDTSNETQQAAPAVAGKRPGLEVKLDHRALHDSGIIDPRTDAHRHTAEQFRSIKRPILTNAEGRGASIVDHPNLIMVTSSLPGEGKTFNSINLAMSIAMEVDKTVLLIDSDVAKPEVASRLGVTATKGLTDVLLDPELELSEVMLRTDVPNLTLLPAGRKHPRATELLASDAMRSMAEELASRYSDRIVIFDSPPLLVTNEARVLAELCGQIVLVIEESRTPQPTVQDSLTMLSSSEIIGLILNKSKRDWGGDYYGGYGHYGYGYGGDSQA